MRPNENITSNEGKKRKQRMSLELYYWEQVGNRFYLRYTRFSLILTIALGLVVIAVVIILKVMDSREQPKPNTEVTAPSPSPSASYPIIRQAPSSPPTRVNKHPQFTMPTPSASPTPDKHANERLTPQQTPVVQPSTPPP